MGADPIDGTGLGAVNTVLTINETPPDDTGHSGCVAWNGSIDVVGPPACPSGSGVAGGDEQTQTQTQTLGDVGITSAFALRVIFNYNEPQSGPSVDNITVEDLVLTIYEPDGAVCFSSGSITPQTYPDTFSGVGTSGFPWRLDAEQAAAANPCFADPQNRVGLASSLTGAQQGPETFFIADATALSPAAADLSVTKSDSPDPVTAGNPLTYTLTVDNDGPNTATNVVVVDTLPASVAFQMATSSQGSCSQSGRTVTCDLGTLPVGETATITIEVTAPGSDGTITNSAIVSADQPDPDSSDNTATEETTVGAGGGTTVDLSLVKSDSPDPVDVGATLTYTLAVQNGGTEANGVTVTDQLPPSVTFVDATASSGSCSAAGQTVTCDLGTLAASASATVTITVTPSQAGTITNSATVSADEPDSDPSDNGATENTEVVSPGGTPGAQVSRLSVTKIDSADPVTVGTAFNYTIDVTNAGPDPATGVDLSDSLPAEVSLLGFPMVEQGTCSATAAGFSCSLGTIAPGDTITVVAEVRADAAGTALNTVVVSGEQTDDDDTDNQDTEETTVEEGPGTVLPIPTVGEWGLILLALLLAGTGALWVGRS